MEVELIYEVAQEYGLSNGEIILNYLCSKYKLKGEYVKEDGEIYAVFTGRRGRTMKIGIDEAFHLYSAMENVDGYYNWFMTGSYEHWTDFKDRIDELLQNLDNEYAWRIALNYL